MDTERTIRLHPATLAEADMLTVIGQARYGNYGQTAIMVEFTDTIINMPETDRD